jgi:hypothetical protein
MNHKRRREFKSDLDATGACKVREGETISHFSRHPETTQILRKKWLPPVKAKQCNEANSEGLSQRRSSHPPRDEHRYRESLHPSQAR